MALEPLVAVFYRYTGFSLDIVSLIREYHRETNWQFVFRRQCLDQLRYQTKSIRCTMARPSKDHDYAFPHKLFEKFKGCRVVCTPDGPRDNQWKLYYQYDSHQYLRPEDVVARLGTWGFHPIHYSVDLEVGMHMLLRNNSVWWNRDKRKRKRNDETKQQPSEKRVRALE